MSARPSSIRKGTFEEIKVGLDFDFKVGPHHPSNLLRETDGIRNAKKADDLRIQPNCKYAPYILKFEKPRTYYLI